ncbi:MAG: DUF4123 domain-containing protein [Planctomycetes bacterium]|nr:DUF4123 domain-containing protein [Planctomycetota bacterium]
MQATARLTKRGLELLREQLFRDPSASTFAVLDGARIEKLASALETHGAEAQCLLAGKLSPSVARTAPYLVRLERDASFTTWLLERGWGKSYGVFVRATLELGTLRRHLKRFLVVAGPDGQRLFFRFYDPRVLRLYLPTLNAEEMAQVFGPVRAYAMESADGRELLAFTPDGVPPRELRLALPE